MPPASTDPRSRSQSPAHSVLALTWLGALGALIMTVRPETASSRLSAYSRVAIWGVAILGVAGLVFAPFETDR